MRRVSSYGGPSGVANSERLKQRLSSTPGLHLLSSSSLWEAGFFAAVGDPQNERVIHRTLGAARNFYPIASNLKQAKRKSWVTRKDPFAPLVKETILFDEPVDTYQHQHCNGGAPAVSEEELEGNLSSKEGLIENGARDGGVEGFPTAPSSGSHVVQEAEFEEVIQTSSSSDHLSDTSTSATFDTGNDRHRGSIILKSEIPSKSSHCSVDLLCRSLQSSLVGDDQAGGHQGAASNLEIERISIALAEADDCVSTLPTIDRQDLGTSRAQNFDLNSAGNAVIRSNEMSHQPEISGGLQDSENKLSKDMAAVEIQSCRRRWQGRKNFKQVKDRVVFLQSLARRSQELNRYHRISQAAVVLQKYWRALQSVQALKRLKTEKKLREQLRINNAAVVLQKLWRSTQSRRLLDNLRKERDERARQRSENAAVVVQRHWRAQRGRCLAKHLKLEQVARDQQRTGAVAVVLQKHWRAWQGRLLVKYLKMEQAVKEKQRIENAALVLQKHWRARQGRFLVKHLRVEQVAKEQQRTNDAAIALQKNWRAKQCRHLVRLLKSELVLREHQRVNNAALVLQKHWRARQGRCLVKNTRMEQVAREQHRTNVAAIVLQKHWRARQDRLYAKHLKLEKFAMEQQRIGYAALVLQKHWRARQGRYFVEQLRIQQVARVLQKLNAATVLQKHWRAQQGRYLWKRLKFEQAASQKQRIDASTVIQKHWRAHQSRAIVENMRKEQLVRQRKMDHVAVVLQTHWRGLQSRCLVKDLKKQQLVNNAVIMVQKCWRARQSRLTMKRLKMELGTREGLRSSAANTLQKHWRARQGMLLVKHMKMEEAVRQQQTLDNAAIIIQKHWRGQHSRLLMSHLKRERALRELERINSAAVVLQKYWRGFQSIRAVKVLYTEQDLRERDALCIQAREKDDETKVKFKAALTIQKAWQLYWSSRLTVSAVSIQHSFPSSSDQMQNIRAVIVLQAYARGFVVRRRLGQMPKSADGSLQPDQAGYETFPETGMASVTRPDIRMTGPGLHTSDVAGYLPRPEDSFKSSPSSSIVHHVEAGVGSLDQNSSSSDRWQKLECAPITPHKQDLSPSLGLDGEFSATSVGGQLQKNGVQEDWNYVAVDKLEECLDTCLAALRPLPSESQHCLPGLDVPDKSQSNGTDQNIGNSNNVNIGEAGNNPSHPLKSPSDASRMQSDHVTSQATSTGVIDNLEISPRPLHETGTQKMENPTQGKSLGRQNSKQNEQRLQQFAQVFLLQRHIALQQQRAQAAPPFPPPMSAGPEIPSGMATEPFENGRGNQGQAVVKAISMHTDSQLNQVERIGPEKHHVVCDIVDPDTEHISTRSAQGCQNSGSKQIIERPRPDVVLDMVLLLRRIEEEYGTSKGDLEGGSSSWCTSGCGDVDEGVPLLDSNSGSMRRENSVAKFVNAINVKYISIPDINAVLLVFIAMVVYTRTVCKGLLSGARQTHRRP